MHADFGILQTTGVRLTGRIVHPPLPTAEAGEEFHTNVSMRPDHDVANTGPSAIVTGDRYEIENVAAGKYLLTAVVNKFRSEPLGSKTVFAIKREVDVGAQDIDLALELGALPEMEGSVVFEAGCTPTPVRVGSMNYPAGDGPAVAVAQDGRFRLPAQSPGRVLLRVTRDSDSNDFLRLMSVRMGDRESPADGFEYPPVAPAALRVVVGCPATRRLP